MSLLPVKEALVRVTAGLKPLVSEQVSLKDAHNRILADDLTATLTLPPFNSSAMDGYAVRAEDITTYPVSLTVIGESAAGHEFHGTLGAGQAARIFTGAPLPKGADTVIMQENAERDGDTVTINQSAEAGNHIRPRGMDFSQGETLLTKGTKLSPRRLSLTASMNHAQVPVTRKPVIAILATGDELVQPGDTPAPDQIISSIPFGLAALVEAAGATAMRLGIARDTEQSLAEAINRAADADILVTIGGASVGDHDLVQQALKSHGMKLDFWKIAMRPGKPLMFATNDNQRVLGLPGNPVSSMICARIFLVPMIHRLLGSDEPDFEKLNAVLTMPIPANRDRQHYMRAIMSRDSYGTLSVKPQDSQDSSLQAMLAGSNCLIIRPPNASTLTIGETVPVMPMDF